MSFNAKDLAIQLSTGGEKIEGLWAMACPACASTGEQAPKPDCQGATEADPDCADPSTQDDGFAERFPGGLALLRNEMRDALGRFG